MKLRHQLFIGLTILVFIVSLLVGCIKEPPPPLRVGGVVWPGFEVLYLARDLGYYKDTSIRLVEYPSASEVLRAYRNGDLEAATITLDEVLLLATTEPHVRVALVADTSHGADVILAKPEIKNLQDLKGRRVGVESTALGAFLLTRALGQVGMLPKDVQVISLEVSEHEQAFKKGTVDAVVTFEPVRSKLLAVGAKLLFDSRQIPGEIVDVLAAREEVLTNQSASMKALLNGWFRALDYLQKHPLDAATRVAPREGVTAQQFLESLKGLRIPDLQENQKLLGRTDASLLQAAKRLSKVMLDNKLLQKAVDPTPLLEDRLVNDVKI
jgi:NitT/TauT family transport system substrate-binding protein